jgi:hypothetical protein
MQAITLSDRGRRMGHFLTHRVRDQREQGQFRRSYAAGLIAARARATRVGAFGLGVSQFEDRARATDHVRCSYLGL